MVLDARYLSEFYLDVLDTAASSSSSMAKNVLSSGTSSSAMASASRGRDADGSSEARRSARYFSSNAAASSMKCF